MTLKCYVAPLFKPTPQSLRHETPSICHQPNWAVKRTPTQAMASPFSWPVLVPSAPSVLRCRLPWALGLRFLALRLGKASFMSCHASINRHRCSAREHRCLPWPFSLSLMHLCVASGLAFEWLQVSPHGAAQSLNLAVCPFGSPLTKQLR